MDFASGQVDFQLTCQGGQGRILEKNINIYLHLQAYFDRGKLNLGL